MRKGPFLLHHLQVLIHRWSTQATHPCQLAHIHLSRQIRRVMLIENRRNIIPRLPFSRGDDRVIVS